MNPKQRAADAALERVQNDMILGLGSGSTAELFIAALGAALSAGRLRGIRGVPTSIASDRQARSLGIPVVSLSQVEGIDLDVDGADEIDPQLNLIKGLGGALLREKIIAQHAKQMLVIADSSKLVATLGMRSPLPVEVVQFEHKLHGRFLRTLGCEPTLRITLDGKPFITDNGNVIYDCGFERIDDPRALDAAIRSRAGIVETGLFIGLASLALVADDAGVRQMQPPR